MNQRRVFPSLSSAPAWIATVLAGLALAACAPATYRSRAAPLAVDRYGYVLDGARVAASLPELVAGSERARAAAERHGRLGTLADVLELVGLVGCGAAGFAASDRDRGRALGAGVAMTCAVPSLVAVELTARRRARAHERDAIDLFNDETRRRYVPVAGAGVVMVSRGLGVAYVRDGTIIDEGLGGEGLRRAVAGVPQAEALARSYVRRKVAALALAVAGTLGCGLAATLAGSDATERVGTFGLCWFVPLFSGGVSWELAKDARFGAVNRFNADQAGDGGGS